MKKRCFLFIILTLAILSFCYADAVETNLVKNAGFEEGVDLEPWGSQIWDTVNPYSTLTLDTTVFRSGRASALIVSLEPNDARLLQQVPVKANTLYAISCWVKTENVGDNKGANISVSRITDTSDDIRGTTSDWREITLYGQTDKKQKTVDLTIGLGGYGATNKGKVWVDDVSMIEIQSPPLGSSIISLYAPPEVKVKEEVNANAPSSNFMNVYLVLFIILALFSYRYFKTKSVETVLYAERSYVIPALIVTVFFKMALSTIVPGFPSDISCFQGWASSAAHDLLNVYSSGNFLDYPPVYIYVLSGIGNLINLLGIDYSSSLAIMLLKLPSIIADAGTAYLLYLVARKSLNEKASLIIVLTYALNPAVIINSTVWGQVDSLFAFLIVAMVIYMQQGKLTHATIILTLAILMKPHGLIFTPILLFEAIRLKDLKLFLKSAACMIGTIALITLPFSIGKSPLWILDLYKSTADSYGYASLNAFNFFGLIGANQIPDSDPFLFMTYGKWGLIFIVIISLLTAFFHLRKPIPESAALTSLFLIAGIFIFSAKMHERYLFTAIPLALLCYILFKDKRILPLYGCLSLTVFINTQSVLALVLATGYPHIPSDDLLLRLVSLINVILFMIISWIIYDILIRKHIQAGIIQATESKSKPMSSTGFMPNLRLTKIDFLTMTILTLLSLSISFFNIGSTQSPETGWTPELTGEAFTVQFDSPVELSRISYYCALGKGWASTGSYQVEALDTTGNWSLIGVLDKNTVFNWKTLNVSGLIQALRITVSEPNGALNKIVFFNQFKQPMENFRISDSSVSQDLINNLFDEPMTAVYEPTFKDGTYFDEIYFARTAYESIHGIVPFENTHPPLGKAIIALGILIFGMNPFGWRIMTILFGAAMIPVMYIFGKKFFGKSFYGFAAAFLMCFDFMRFTQTQIGTVDGFLILFIILSYYFMSNHFLSKPYTEGENKGYQHLLLSGIFMGLAMSVKWVGVYAGLGLAFLLFYKIWIDAKSEQRPQKINSRVSISKFSSKRVMNTLFFCVLAFVVIPVLIYSLSYLTVYQSQPEKPLITQIIQSQKNMLDYHSQLNATHPYASSWYDWPVIKTPLLYYYVVNPDNQKVSVITAMGNPAIWWLSIFSVGFAAWMSIKRRDVKMMIPLVAIAALYIPWMLVTRLTFIYHFFACVPFILLTIVYGMNYFIEKHPLSKYPIYFYLAVVLGLFILFYPPISGFEVSKAYLESLKWFKTWVF